MPAMLSYNGALFHRDDLCISPGNRAFRYGDGVFETIKVARGKVLWADKHFSRIMKGSHILQLNMPADWTQHRFEEHIIQLYSANHPNQGPARIRLSLFRDQGGFYAPLTNNAAFLIESEPLDHELFILNTKGVSIDLYEHIRKPVNLLSALKSINAQLYVLASLHKREQGTGDCLLMNEFGHIAEATSSNLFIKQKGLLITPPLSEGCVDGVMRRVIIEVAASQQISLKEQPIRPADLKKAEEVFLTNTIHGVRWVSNYQDRMYGNTLSSQLIEALNNRIS